MDIKLCGLTTQEAIETAVQYGASHLGFIFYTRSPRNVTPQQAAALVATLPDREKISLVAVVVDAPDALIQDIMTSLDPDIIQCHGKETPERVLAIKKLTGRRVIKAFAVRDSDDIAEAKTYEHVVDGLLFDAKAPAAALPGGNGLSFDWTLLAGRTFALPWFLSGGLNEHNVLEAIRMTGATRIDASSSIESSPGVKDPERIKAFLNTVLDKAVVS